MKNNIDNNNDNIKAVKISRTIIKKNNNSNNSQIVVTT